MPLFLPLLLAQDHSLQFIDKDNNPIADLGIAFSAREGAVCYISDSNGVVIVPSATFGPQIFYPCTHVSALSRSLVFNTTRFEFSELNAASVIRVCQMFKLTVELPSESATISLISDEGTTEIEPGAQIWTLEAPDCDVFFTKIRVAHGNSVCEFAVSTQADMHLRCPDTSSDAPPKILQVINAAQRIAI